MKALLKLFGVGYIAVSLLFWVCGIALLGMAGMEIWGALAPAVQEGEQPRFVAILECIGLLTIAVAILECIGLLTIAVAAFELGQTVLEEEVQREASISTPTRVRRFLSRFLIVVIVSLAIECLVSAFQSLHGHPELLPHAGVIGLCAATLLLAWGAFVRLNIAAEQLEPQAMEEAQAEDGKIAT